MADNDQGLLDLDTLTDDEVMNLNPEQIQALQNQENIQDDVSNEPNSDAEEHSEVVPDDAAGGEAPSQEEASTEEVQESASDSEEESASQASEEPSDNQEGPGISPQGAEEGQTEDPSGDQAAKDPEQVKEVSDAAGDKDAGKVKKPEAKTQETPEQLLAMDFYTKITAPFKADHREIKIKSPEDAIRMMQMGVNYSRRMAEMKPLKALSAMLQQNGLDDPQKLNYLIDLHNGEPEAIKKLLKEKNIDPIDIDVSTESVYRGNDYQVDPKQLAFQEAIDNTMTQTGGSQLITDINDKWDDDSKNALKEQPAIFANLLEQMQEGVYEQTMTELEYQKNLGKYADVPFLQAYHQVGSAMEQAGVFNKEENTVTNSIPAGKQPIDTGSRKVAQVQKNEQPNPNLSSATIPTPAPPSGGTGPNPTDYGTMSDDEFLKLGAPG